ncbi:MAG: hypothetical protein QXY40_04790 [Candidatus Methanomethylicia archaeon]
MVAIDIYEAEQKIIDVLVNQSVSEIKPVLDRAQVIRYPLIEDVLGLPGPEVLNILTQLYELGSLQRRLYFRVAVCPKCGVIDPLLISISCPNCNSVNVFKKVFVRHVKCGYEGLEDSFSVGSCPKCNVKYTRSKDFIKKIVFECSDCGKQFKCPGITYTCRSCFTSSSIGSVSFMDVYSYSISRLNLLKVALISRIKDLFTSLGYRVETPGYVEGISGLKHRFDIYASKQNNSVRMLISIYVFDKPIDERAIMNSFAVSFDIYPLQSIIIAIPGISESARQFSQVLKTNIIEASNIEQALEKFKNFINQNIKQII